MNGPGCISFCLCPSPPLSHLFPSFFTLGESADPPLPAPPLRAAAPPIPTVDMSADEMGELNPSKGLFEARPPRSFAVNDGSAGEPTVVTPAPVAAAAAVAAAVASASGWGLGVPLPVSLPRNIGLVVLNSPWNKLARGGR